MKSRLLVVTLLVLVGAALYFGVAQPHVSKIPRRVRSQLPDLKPIIPPPPQLPLPAMDIPPMPAVTPPLLPAVEKK